MSPVHVIVGEDQRAETMWATAFAGAVDLYAFPRNVDAFERLTAAAAPVDLVVLTPAQSGPFNLTPDQFVARVLEGPLGRAGHLQSLHVIVVGQALRREHPRAMAVSTMDAAIRLVKFGEIETAPRPGAAPAAAAPAPPSTGGSRRDPLAGGTFSDGVISRIWNAGDRASAEREPTAVPPRDTELQPRLVETVPLDEPIARPAQIDTSPLAPPEPPQLFSRSAPAGFVVAPRAPQPGGHESPPVTGGGHAGPVGAPGELIEVASGMLQASRPYVLPNGAGYRGPALRAGQVQASAHGMMDVGQPVPPALAQQVQSMVYGSSGAADPMLTWSSSARGQVVTSGVPVPARPAGPGGVLGGGAQHHPAAAPAPAGMPPARVVSSAAVRSVPMQPPPGAYPGAGVASAPVQRERAPADPFLARAEQHGGDVSFG